MEQAALELFGERGYDATSIAEIGARAGITKSVLYHYFSSKADLYAAVCAHQTADLIEAVRRQVARTRATPSCAQGSRPTFGFWPTGRPLGAFLLRDRPAARGLADIHDRLEQERAQALTALLASPGKRATNAVHLELVAVGVRAFVA